MPLLGKKIFVCVNPLKDITTNETVYTIPHTKEQFRSKKYPFKTITCVNQDGGSQRQKIVETSNFVFRLTIEWIFNYPKQMLKQVALHNSVV